MLVYLPKDRVRKGMFIESVECSSHEFSKRRFLLRNDKDHNAIMASSAKMVLINLSLGSQPKDTSSQGGEGNDLDRRDGATAIEVKRDLDVAATELRSSFESIISGTAADLTSLTPIVQSITATWSDNSGLALELTRLKSKDEVTFVHSLAVGALMTVLGRAMDMDEETTTLFGLAGFLHDIGKLLIPNEILTKEGKLTDEERHIIRQHPERGYQLLKDYPGITPTVLDICRLHHEVLDGSGYPLGLKADRLPLHVRISTVCDVFEALTSVRPYKKPWTTADAIKWMFDRPQQFDRKIVLRLGGILS